MRTLAMLTIALGIGLGLQPAVAQTKAGTDKAFCAEGSANMKGPDCRFDTMAQCQAEIKGQSTAKCVANAKTPAKK
jgi:hypothetical protein